MPAGGQGKVVCGDSYVVRPVMIQIILNLNRVRFF